MSIDNKVGEKGKKYSSKLEEILAKGGTMTEGGVEFKAKKKPWYYYLQQPLTLPLKLAFLTPKISTMVTPKVATLTNKVAASDPDLKNLRFRYNHDSPLGEVWRLWTDPYIRKSRSLFEKILGTPFVLVGDTITKIMRMDHYNPWTHTAVSYTPIEASTLGNLGQAKFFARSKYRLFQTFASMVGVGKYLWQQPYAASYANKHLPPHQAEQTGRYLYPLVMGGLGRLFGFGYYGIAAGFVTGYIVNKVRKIFKTRFPKFYDKYQDLKSLYTKKAAKTLETLSESPDLYKKGKKYFTK